MIWFTPRDWCFKVCRSTEMIFKIFLDERFQTRMSIPFVVVGHVDAGKSTFCGQLLRLCGFVDEHQMLEIEKQAIADKME